MQFLEHVKGRPIYGRTVKANVASRRVLEARIHDVRSERHSPTPAARMLRSSSSSSGRATRTKCNDRLLKAGTPGNHQSAGKRRSGRPRHGSKRLQSTLTESAKAAARTKGSYLSAQYTRLRGRRDPGKATGALRHSILVAAYQILDQNVPYHELGADYFDRRSSQQRTKRLIHQLEQLGHTVNLEPLAA